MTSKISLRNILVLSIFFLLFNHSKAVAQEGGPVSYQEFYDQLSPYGDWVNDPDYGYAWVPDAGPDFQPYRTHGHWVYTDYGWTWVSDYQWGWAAFHYGRWKYSDSYGWLWIPGYVWGPAWVSWRSSGGYYGWAPLEPAPVRYNEGYNDGRQYDNGGAYGGNNYNGDNYNGDNYNGGNYGGGSSIRISIGGFSLSWGNAAPAEQWCFVPANYIASPYVANYYAPQEQTTNIYNNTTIIKNTYVTNTTVNNNTVNNYNTVNNNKTVYIAGPPRADVERATGQRIQPVAIRNASSPGVAGIRGNGISMYRPPVINPISVSGRVQRGAAFPAPARAVALNQVRPITERPVANRSLVTNNPVSHLNSTDTHPTSMARQNFTTFRADPRIAMTQENQRYVKAGTANTNPAVTMPRPASSPARTGISAPENAGRNAQGIQRINETNRQPAAPSPANTNHAAEQYRAAQQQEQLRTQQNQRQDQQRAQLQDQQRAQQQNQRQEQLRTQQNQRQDQQRVQLQEQLRTQQNQRQDQQRVQLQDQQRAQQQQNQRQEQLRTQQNQQQDLQRAQLQDQQRAQQQQNQRQEQLRIQQNQQQDQQRAQQQDQQRAQQQDQQRVQQQQNQRQEQLRTQQNQQQDQQRAQQQEQQRAQQLQNQNRNPQFQNHQPQPRPVQQIRPQPVQVPKPDQKDEKR